MFRKVLVTILAFAIFAAMWTFSANAAAEPFYTEPVVEIDFTSSPGDKKGGLSYQSTGTTGYAYGGNVTLGNQFAIEIRGTFGAGVPIYHSAYQMEAYSDGTIESWWTDTVNPHIIATGVNMSGEHHIVLVGDVNSYKMYIDGSLVASQTGVSLLSSWVLAGTDNYMTVGHGMSSIKSFKVYPDAPTANEVLGLYTGVAIPTPSPTIAPTPTLAPEPAEGEDYTIVAGDVAPFSSGEQVTVKLTVSGIPEGTSILGFDWEIPYDTTLLDPVTASFTSSCEELNVADSELAWEMIVREESEYLVVTLLDDGEAMKGISENDKLWVELVFTALADGVVDDEILYVSYAAGTLGGDNIDMAYGKGDSVSVSENIVVTPTPLPTPSVGDFELEQTSSYVRDDVNMVIKGIEPSTTADDFLFNFVNLDLLIYNDGVEVYGNVLVGTGTVITNGTTEYTVVQLGDINGDGKVAAADYMLIKRAILGNSLTTAQSIAADVDSNGSIATADYMKVKKYISGGYELY